MQKDNDKGFALLEILGGLVVISLASCRCSGLTLKTT